VKKKGLDIMLDGNNIFRLDMSTQICFDGLSLVDPHNDTLPYTEVAFLGQDLDPHIQL